MTVALRDLAISLSDGAHQRCSVGNRSGAIRQMAAPHTMTVGFEVRDLAIDRLLAQFHKLVASQSYEETQR
jgi:hypothetical protein